MYVTSSWRLSISTLDQRTPLTRFIESAERGPWNHLFLNFMEETELRKEGGALTNQGERGRGGLVRNGGWGC